MDSQIKQFKTLIFSMLKDIRAQLEKEFKASGIMITILQYSILTSLEESSTTLNELAKVLANKPPTLIPALGHLEKDGYITRNQDKKDRRKVQLQITTKGKAIIKKIQHIKKTSGLQRGFEKIGKQKTETLIKILQELSDTINK